MTDITEDLLEIISDLIVYEDSNKKIVDDYEYAYDYAYDYYDYAEKEKPTSIKIDL